MAPALRPLPRAAGADRGEASPLGWSAAARDGAAWVDTRASLVVAPAAPGRTLSRVSRSTARAQTARGAVLVAVGMTAMNVAAYAFTLVAARRLGPDGYSVVAALMGVVLVVNVLALGVQATTARHVAQHGDDPRTATEMVRTARAVGPGPGRALPGALPVAARLLRLDSWLTAATVAVTAAALTVTGAQLGILQGHRSWRAFAGLCLDDRGGPAARRRHRGGAVADAARRDDRGGPRRAGAARRRSPADPVTRRRRPPARGPPRRHAVPHRHSCVTSLHDSHTLLAFFALTQVDVFAARVMLPADEAGIYASGLILTKAVLFLPTFVTVMAFPTLARRTGPRHLHLAGLGVILGIGAGGRRRHARAAPTRPGVRRRTGVCRRAARPVALRRAGHRHRDDPAARADRAGPRPPARRVVGLGGAGRRPGRRALRRPPGTPCCCSCSASTRCCSPCSCASPGRTSGSATASAPRAVAPRGAGRPARPARVAPGVPSGRRRASCGRPPR